MSIQTFRNIDTTSFILTTLLLFTSFAGFSQDYKTAKAQNGDGIYSLLKRHGVPASEFKNFIEKTIRFFKLTDHQIQIIIHRNIECPRIKIINKENFPHICKTLMI